MKKSIFYLSKGSLNSIIERDSLWVAASNDISGDHENVTITIDNPRPLVQVTKVEKFQYYPNTLIPRIVLELFDGETNLPVSIELNNHDNIICDEENISNVDIQKPIVRTGSILMIHRYRLIHSTKYFTTEELSVENIPNKILCITDFSLIGYSENIYNLSDNIIEEAKIKTVENNNNNNNNKLDVDISHNIADLNPRLSKQQWSIKCRLMEKTLVREFENRQNGVKGRVMRLLLLDKTSQIEMVAFNEHCDNESLKNMKLKKYFIIKNGEIKVAKNNLKSWPDQVSLQFEILITNQTEIIEAQREESDSEDDNIIVSEDKESEMIDNHNKNQTKPVLHHKFTLFNELVKKKCESLVDVIGIITEIGELKKIKKNDLSIRNFKMVDKTKTIITFALWGKQAESFDSKIGSVLLINKAKITNYGGLSLSVIRISEIIKINPNSNNKIANDLYEWWRDKWWKSRSNNQQFRQKRAIESDESDEEQGKEDSLKKRKT